MRLRNNFLPIIIMILTFVSFYYNIFTDAKIISAAPSQLQTASIGGIINTNIVFQRDNISVNAVLIEQGRRVEITGDIQQLKLLLGALAGARQRSLHIAHWGDSIILGDVISENLRELFQKQYGGSGVGFVSIRPDDFGMRASTGVTFSDDWKEASFVKMNPDKLPLGINGACFVAGYSSWVRYEVGRFARSIKNYTLFRVFYSNAPNGASITYQLSNGSTQTIKLESGSSLHEAKITTTPVTSIKMTFNNAQGGYFYGTSLENGSGVYLDNLPLRGNSGANLIDIPMSRLKEFNSLMNYKLLIINFGVNVLSPEHKDYNWYEIKMNRVISYLKDAFPQTSILLVSTSDRAIKKGSQFVSDPGIPSLINTQRAIAQKNSIAFWNFSEAMGGTNTIVGWVNMKPPLANSDYCHLTSSGGKLVADLLFGSIQNALK